MVDTTSIILSVVSLVGAIGVALFTGYMTYAGEERKRRQEINKLVRQYRDPLLTAAFDLQDRMWELLEKQITHTDRRRGNGEENVGIFTCYLFAQFIAWTHALKMRAQFLAFQEDRPTRDLRGILYKISDELSTNRYDNSGQTFRLWPGHQLAIAECMMVKDEKTGEIKPMGWHEFRLKFNKDETFNERKETYLRKEPEATKPVVKQDDDVAKREAASVGKDRAKLPGPIKQAPEEPFVFYFAWMHESIFKMLDRKRREEADVQDQRLRRLQHLLIDLLMVLDPAGETRSDREAKRCRSAAECDCTNKDCNGTQLAAARQDRTRSYRDTPIVSEGSKETVAKD